MKLWLPVAGFPAYEVSRRGVVRNAKTKKPLVATLNEPGGYYRVALYRDGKPFNVRLHVAVLEAFVGPRPSSRHVGAHGPDNDRANCALKNLRWALPEENEADKLAHGTQPKGRLTPFLARSTREEIKKLIECGMSHNSIARVHGVHRKTVARLARAVALAKEVECVAPSNAATTQLSLSLRGTAPLAAVPRSCSIEGAA